MFRRYPGNYEGIIPTLCENLDSLDEPESKAAMIWIIGQFTNRIENAEELLDDLLYTFLEESVEVNELYSDHILSLNTVDRFNSLFLQQR